MANDVKPRVFVINKGGHDYTDAERYGELVFLTEGLLRNPYGAAGFYRQVAEKMKDATSEDYILVTSLNAMCTVVGWIVGRLGLTLNLLLFKDEKYVVRRIEENGLLEIIRKGKGDGV